MLLGNILLNCHDDPTLVPIGQLHISMILNLDKIIYHYIITIIHSNCYIKIQT